MCCGRCTVCGVHPCFQYCGFRGRGEMDGDIFFGKDKVVEERMRAANIRMLEEKES